MKKEYIKPAIVEELMLVAEEQILTDSIRYHGNDDDALGEDEEWD